MRTLYYILLLLFFISCKTRKESLITTDFSLQRPSIYLIDSIEKKNNGIRVYPSYTIGVAKDYFPNADKFKLGQPFVFTRDTSKLMTQVTYFFSVPDSTLRLVEYSWNAAGKRENTISQLFSSNKTLLSKYFKNKGTESEIKEDTWSQKNTIWENDSTYAKQFMLIQGKPTRTRVLISWK